MYGTLAPPRMRLAAISSAGRSHRAIDRAVDVFLGH